MKLLSRSLIVAFAACAIASLSQCGMPGQTLGIYSVDATIQTNTCGAGLDAPTPWKFNVELSVAATRLYWNTMDGNPLLDGDVSNKSVTLVDDEAGSADGAPDGAPGPCEMERDETIALDLDSSTKPNTFTGTLTYTFEVVAGSDCSDQMSAQGGMYDALPCTLAYGVNGAYSHTD